MVSSIIGVAVAIAAVQSVDLPYPRSLFPARTVFVASTVGLSHDDQVTLQTLAGVLARTTPSIYTVDSATSSASATASVTSKGQRFGCRACRGAVAMCTFVASRILLCRVPRATAALPPPKSWVL